MLWATNTNAYFQNAFIVDFLMILLEIQVPLDHPCRIDIKKYIIKLFCWIIRTVHLNIHWEHKTWRTSLFVIICLFNCPFWFYISNTEKHILRTRTYHTQYLSYVKIIQQLCNISFNIFSGVAQICSLGLGEVCGDVANPQHDWEVKLPDVPKPLLKERLTYMVGLFSITYCTKFKQFLCCYTISLFDQTLLRISIRQPHN